LGIVYFRTAEVESLDNLQVLSRLEAAIVNFDLLFRFNLARPTYPHTYLKLQ
jgi:hypothetical protein